LKQIIDEGREGKKKVEEVVRKKLTCEKSFFYFLHKSNKAMSHGTKIFKKQRCENDQKKRAPRLEPLNCLREGCCRRKAEREREGGGVNSSTQSIIRQV
jgi:hypothetical protein